MGDIKHKKQRQQSPGSQTKVHGLFLHLPYFLPPLLPLPTHFSPKTKSQASLTSLTTPTSETGFLKLSKNTIAVMAILLTALLIFVLYEGYYYFKHQTVLSSLENPSTVNLQEYEKNEVLIEINELYTLEDNQNAVIGKITNIERLASRHDFFKKAKNGDYLLVMPQFTLIYSRENKQVVDIARENLLDLKEAK